VTPFALNREPLEIMVRIHGEGESTVLVPAEKDLYAYEADMVGEHIAQRQAPAMSWDDSLGNIRVLDRWRGQIGLTYEMEKPKNCASHHHGPRAGSEAQQHEVWAHRGR
jgi:hypothetical protein